ncbi:MAG: lipoprotein signal peptidase [Bacteroidales bacterium]|nr:lipoprotein signal peptidase [Bacteroidales bacterium]
MKKQGSRGLVWSFVVILLVLLIDQILKIWVKTSMTLNQETPILGHWFNLLFVENNGMAFGWLGGGGWWKLALSLFRIVAIVALFWILIRQAKKGTKFGVLFGLALITAGAMGNIIDSVFYGRIFSESTFTQVATLFPDGGGYAGWLHGRVVDMLYFPIIDVAKENASWLPDFFFGPDGHFIFFRPIFNFADAAITIGVFYMLLFQWKWLKTLK